VGREQEIGILRECWKQVVAGRGQVVLVSGEAGIGKSRLAQVFKPYIGATPHLRLESRCWPSLQQRPLHPVLDLVWRWLRVPRDAPSRALRYELEQTLAGYDLRLEETVPLLASWLVYPHADDDFPLRLTFRQRRQKTLDALVSWLQQETRRQPVYFILEDLHWADTSTLAWLDLLIEQTAKTPLLLLLTYQPDFLPPWGRHAHLTQIALSRLSPGNVETMTDQLTGGALLPQEVRQRLVTSAAGIPLFIEACVAALMESGLLQEQKSHNGPTPRWTAAAIPATGQEALQCRLRQLGHVAETLQLAATFGEEFAYALLQDVSLLDEAALQHELARLVEAGVLVQQGEGPQATYAFAHSLLHEAAYALISEPTRLQCHTRIAQRLDRDWPQFCEAQPELVAPHFAVAGRWKEAMTCWRRAGQYALEHAAYTEAVAYHVKRLEILASSVPVPTHTQAQLTLQTTLDMALATLADYTSQAKEQIYARAWELCSQINDMPQRMQVMQGFWAFYLVRGEWQSARELGEHCWQLAQDTQRPLPCLVAHHILGMTLSLQGELWRARDHLERGFALYQRHRPQAHSDGCDIGVSCLAYLAKTLWLLGYPERAWRTIREALSLAQDLDHPWSMACVLTETAWHDHMHWQGRHAQEQAAAVIHLATEQGWPHWAAQGMVQQGWARVAQGQVETGLELMHQGIATVKATGVGPPLPGLLALVAAAYGRAGQIPEGLAALAAALEMVHRDGGSHYIEAELYRLWGELFLCNGATHEMAEAEERFGQALDIARRQRAKSLELRVVVSLSRLWQRQGRRQEAWQLLVDTCRWFTEGKDTPDFLAAQALLEDLG
jgi:tetratricopeptide (TPR) repeat protein